MFVRAILFIYESDGVWFFSAAVLYLEGFSGNAVKAVHVIPYINNYVTAHVNV